MIDATVTVFRYTPRLASLMRFYERVGLRTQLTSDAGNYAELVGTSGRLHLHAADSTETALQFHVPDARKAAADLESEGIDHALWDESYGMQLAVEHPVRPKIWIGEDQQDWYGYTQHTGTHPLVSVTAVWGSTDFGLDRDFFARFGFIPTSWNPADGWQALTRGPGRGTIRLHAPAHNASEVLLGLETTESADALDARLRAAGLATRRHADEFSTYVAVTDPDGVEVPVHVP